MRAATSSLITAADTNSALETIRKTIAVAIPDNLTNKAKKIEWMLDELRR